MVGALDLGSGEASSKSLSSSAWALTIQAGGKLGKADLEEGGRFLGQRNG